MLLYVNGRDHFFNREIILNKARAGYWFGTVNGCPFNIYGGKHAGGSSRDWFVECGEYYGENTLQADSLAECLMLLDGA